MDARHFKAPYLRRTDIWKQADELRQRLLPQATLPVPVLDLAEFDLGLELVPKANLCRAGDIDALLLGDLKTIVVDRDALARQCGSPRPSPRSVRRGRIILWDVYPG